ncbi:MAG: hypothetical protein KDD47_22135, partial [Acidobacteria bacterium]|nr:hypothetical protein [Acidobacteriota bacterium]
FAPAFGALIHFYDLDDRIDGDWSEFYASDPALTLAAVATFDPKEGEGAFRRALGLAAGERRLEAKANAFLAAARALAGLARRADGWLRGLEGAARRSPDGAAAQLRGELVAELAEPLTALAAYARGAGQRQALAGVLGGGLDLGLEELDGVWGLSASPPDSSIFWGETEAERIAHALPALAGILEDLLGGFDQLRRRALELLPQALEAGDHRPQSALYVAFARLFQKAQATLNTFDRRYVDFYYRRVLDETPRGPVADRLYLAFSLAEQEGVLSASVPRGTLFPAGEDAGGQEILYAATSDLVVTRAKLERVRTLRALLQEGSAAGSAAPSQLLASEVVFHEAPSPWPTFGPEAPGLSATEVTEPATLGLALASPYLLLTGGKRRIELTFSYRLAQEVPQRVLREVLRRRLRLALSGEEGWFSPPRFKVRVDEPASTFTLSARLAPEAPAVTPLGAEGALPNPAPELPTLTLRLDQEPLRAEGGEVYPLAVLSGMGVEKIGLTVQVEDLPDLVLESTDGELDATSVFLPFGGSPAVGSFLALRHRELFVKKLTGLSVGIRWFDLPPNEDGFTGYYKDYVVGLDGEISPTTLFDNRSFQGSFRVRNPGSWSLAESSLPTENGASQALLAGSEAVYLFRAGSDCGTEVPEACGPLCPESTFRQFLLRRHRVPAWYDPEESALELTLTAPPYAFGADLYTQNVLYWVLQDVAKVEKELGASRRGRGFRWEEGSGLNPGELAGSPISSPGPASPQRPLRSVPAPRAFPEQPAVVYPNEPWIPQAEGVRVGYEAGVTLTPGEEGEEGELFHLLPFGGYEVLAAGTGGEATLLPEVDAEGQLLLGFSGLEEPQTLSLLFEMAAFAGNGGEGAPTPLWSVLAPEGWQALPSREILLDGTGGLQQTGILALALPGLAPSGSRTVPGDLAWLRASVKAGAGLFPETAGIVPHVLSAERVLNGAAPVGPLPAGTITSSVEELPEIASVSQPLASFGGRPAETPPLFETRVGERLRHKDRGILAWDVERLVLERF